MNTKLKILHIEDLPSDAELVHRTLKKAGLDYEVRLVDRREEYEEALRSFSPDLILSDHSLPAFNSREALQMLKNTGKKIPFILITATVSEEFAVSVMKEGADDYILKDRMKRLPNAILATLERYELEKQNRQHLEELERNEKKFRALIENSSDGINLLNEKGEIIYQSPSVNRILGYEFEEVKGKTIFDFIHPDEIQDAQRLVESAIQSPGIPQYNEYRVRHKNGIYIWIEGAITNHLHDEAVKAFIVNYRNITSRKNAEQLIQSLNESLEKKVQERTAQLQIANNELEAFNYTVSHDLRSPLQVISGYASVLYRKYERKLPEEAQAMLLGIRDYVKKMGIIIEELLNFSKLGRVELKRQIVDADSMIEEILDEIKRMDNNFRAQVIHHPINLVHCDAAMLKHVWTNLLTNAVKYSAKMERPVIEIGCREIKGETVFYVRDNGVGFDMKYADKLFAVFQRLPNTLDIDGTGVGLALVQRIVMRHGGKIWAESKLNEGATFYFTLPDN